MMGLGSIYVPGGDAAVLQQRPFIGNLLTSDPVRYARNVAVLESEPSLATGWDTAPGGRVLYIDPTRLGALLADRGEVRRLIGPEEEMPAVACMTEVARMLTALPRTTSTVRSAGTSMEWDFAFDLAADTAALFRGHPLPGWVVAGQIINVVMNLIAFAIALVVALGLIRRAEPRHYPGDRARAIGAGR